MSGFTQTIVVGNIGRVDEMRYLQSGVPVLNFTLAVNTVSGQGESRQEKTTWFRVALWRQLAESLQPYLQKGKQVMVVGQVDARAYKDNNGEAQASLELTARDVRLLGGKEGGGNGNGGDYGNNWAGEDIASNEIPF